MINERKIMINERNVMISERKVMNGAGRGGQVGIGAGRGGHWAGGVSPANTQGAGKN